METEYVLSEYTKLGINSQNELYNFMISSDTANVCNINYNLKNSNEAMEFMASFLTALGFEVTRLYFEKRNCDKTTMTNKHWFLAFKSEFKWFYYETTLKDIQGQYSFESYKNLTNFSVTNLINLFEKNSDGDNNKLSDKYILKEIKPLTNFDLKENIVQSEDGAEILVWSDLVGNFTYEQFIAEPKQKDLNIHRKKKSSSFGLFLVGFTFTLVFSLFILWVFTMIFSGNK